MKPNKTRIPEYALNPHRSRKELHALKARLRKARLHTVCESARCPNMIECSARPTAAFMILGDRCNRGCRFCAVPGGAPCEVDPAEPEAVAAAAAELGLKYVVVTSVTRDDLPDEGASQFAAVTRAIRARLPEAKVELLIPDFQGSREALETVIAARPDVVNHNLETVPRLYPEVRPGADYHRSLEVLAWTDGNACCSVKSGLMVGLGERVGEVVEVIKDLKNAGCEVVTVGQYLQPRRDRLPVARYWRPEEYEQLVEVGRELGLLVIAGPLVRSSYFADQAFEQAHDCER